MALLSTGIMRGVVGDRPAASAATAGRLYAATDEGKLYRDNGSTWDEVTATAGGAPAAHASSHQNGGGDEISVAGLSGELADPQPPKTHATNHKSGGSDAVKLDELAAPTDVTSLNASTSAHGLCPKLDNDATHFLNGQGGYTTPTAGDIGGIPTSLIDAAGDLIIGTADNTAGRLAKGTDNQILAIDPATHLPAWKNLGDLTMTITTKDGGASWTPTRQYTTSTDMTTAADITALPTSGQKVVLDDLIVSAAVAMEFSLVDGNDGTTVLASLFLPANGAAQITPRDGLKNITADKKIQGKASAAGNVRVTTLFHSEA